MKRNFVAVSKLSAERRVRRIICVAHTGLQQHLRDMEIENQTQQPVITRPPRRRGRPATMATEKYTLALEAETAEWAKQQPGGLSHLLRCLLRQEYEKNRRVS